MKNSKANFYNRQYNNRELVPDFQHHLNEMAFMSEKVRRSTNCQLNIAYEDQGLGSGQTFDFFPAKASSKPSALLVFIHGGYWRALDKKDHSFIAPTFIENEIALAIPNYSLCPSVRVEDIVMELMSCIRWLYLHAKELNIDPARIYIAGHSAGGQLVTQLLCALWPVYDARLPANLIQGGLSLSGIHDMEMMRLAPFLQKDLKLTKASVAKLSTAYIKPNPHIRLIAAVGGAESPEFLRQNKLIARAWKSQCIQEIELLGKNHFTALLELAQKNTVLSKALLRLIKSR